MSFYARLITFAMALAVVAVVIVGVIPNNSHSKKVMVNCGWQGVTQNAHIEALRMNPDCSPR